MRLDFDEEFWEKHSVTRPREPTQLCDRFEALLNKDPMEREVQDFLEENPWLLSEQFPHCHFVLPRFSLQGQYVMDFLLPERQSGDTMWVLVEIEKPKAQLVTKRGEFAETIRYAIQQVKDWRMWLLDNQDTAKKSRLKGGLGLHDMSRLMRGFVLVGRRADVCPRFNQLRTDLLSNEAISIATYDRVLDWARKRAAFWQGYDGA